MATILLFPDPRGRRLAEQRMRLEARTRQREKAEAVLVEARRREAEELQRLVLLEEGDLTESEVRELIALGCALEGAPLLGPEAG